MRRTRRLAAIVVLALAGFAATHSGSLTHLAGGTIGDGGPLIVHSTLVAGGTIGDGGPLMLAAS